MEKKGLCTRAGKALTAGDAHARALRVSDSIAAAGVRGGAAEVVGATRRSTRTRRQAPSGDRG